jgi:ribonuclease R
MDKKKSHKSPRNTGKRLSVQQLQKAILALFQRHPKKRLNPKQIARKLNAENNKDSVEHALEKLSADNLIKPLGDFKFMLKSPSSAHSNGPESGKADYCEGIVDMTRSGDAYITDTGTENDIHVSAKYMNTAMHGDRVQVRTWTPRGRRKPEGEVVKVLERFREHFIGTLWLYPRHAIVSLDTRLPVDVAVELAHILDAKDGDRVVVRIEKWAGAQNNYPQGVVTAVLGQAGSNDVEMKSILINNGFDLEFPPEVLRDAERFPDKISPQEADLRRDMRDVLTFTIDPEDAKDYDDALSIKYLENGEMEIGIHIADVTYYVQEDSPLDQEAFQRSTSVYLVDRVLPMLPERLSNGLCSLVPNEDRLAFSAIFTFTKGMKISGRWFGRTIIHSDRRFTYAEAQEVLEGRSDEFGTELRDLNKIAKHLRKQRFKNGAINFETDEVRFKLDEHGVPILVFVKERKDAHLLVEDFMLLANREVAAYIHKKGQHEEIPFVYRVHDEPDMEKVAQLARFAHELGFEMDISSPRAISNSYNRLAEATEQDPSLKLLSPIAIRTMAKAIYSSDNVGHYGLGFEHYTHFTSPIRRYSDVLSHRLLERNLGQTHRTNKHKLEEQCKHISRQERRAVDAERESVKYKQVEYISKHLGEVFPGLISGFMERGFFVELTESRVEGMVAFETLDEPFTVAESRLRMAGTHSGREYKMGQEVQVRIARADLAKRQVDMEWVRDEPPAQGGKAPAAKAKGNNGRGARGKSAGGRRGRK